MQQPMNLPSRDSGKVSDYELAREAANGVTSSIGDLYERHRKTVYALCLRMTGNRAEAEDLTHEVFIQLLRKISTFRGDSLFTTWLHRLTVNQVLMQFRRANYHLEELTFEVETRRPFWGDRNSMGSHLLERLTLNAALARLPSGRRAVFTLFAIQGYKHEEIANIFGCSVGNSKSQLHKAKKKLRKLLQRHQ